MNNQIFYFFYNFAHQSVLVDNLIVLVAFYFPFAVVMLAGLFLLFHHEVVRAENPFRVFLEKKREILLAFFSAGIAWILAVILKYLIHLPRPVLVLQNIQPLFEKTSFSFPSEHASFFMALALSIFFLHKKAGYWFIFFALLIGLARIVAGVHFPADILGGFILGIVIAYLVEKFS